MGALILLVAGENMRTIPSMPIKNKAPASV